MKAYKQQLHNTKGVQAWAVTAFSWEKQDLLKQTEFFFKCVLFLDVKPFYGKFIFFTY